MRYNDALEVINNLIEKRKYKWYDLQAITGVEWEDVAQKLRLHLFNKWHLYDSNKSLICWVNKVITHQLQNIVRNHYGYYSSPCWKCPHKLPDNGCSMYGVRSEACELFARWKTGKKRALDIKMADSLNRSTNQHTDDQMHLSDTVPDLSNSYYDFDSKISEFHEFMRNALNDIQWLVYKSFYIDGEDEIIVKDILQKYIGSSKCNQIYSFKKIKADIYQKALQVVRDFDLN